MNYPLISDYISSILSAEDNLATRTSLRPVINSTGDPIMTSGNFAVVFKMVDINDNKNYAMKCFLRDQEGREESYLQICDALEFVESRYLLKTEYLPGELFVDTNQSNETEFPVLLMEWVEGNTLGSYISDNYSDSFKISQLAYSFSKMASWLLSQDLAHGDIKPDNIIVKDNGNLVLVDYDGMYVPSMKGSIARENGSPNFRHPERTERDFNEHIDDFSLAVLNLTLKVLSLDYGAITAIVANDYCIFNERDYHDIYGSLGLDYIDSHLNEPELQKLWGIFLIALSEKKLSSISFRLSCLSLPSKDGNYSKLTELTDDETQRKKEDGIVLDRSGKRLIAANVSNDVLEIPEGIEVICQRALQSSTYKSIVLPDSIKAIGGIAFANNEKLEQINIPKGITFIEHSNPFGGCINLTDIRIDSPNYIIEDDCVYSRDHRILFSSLFTGDAAIVEVHPETKIIAGNAFWQRDVQEIILPNGLSVISDSGTFGKCKQLKRLIIPNSVAEIGSSAFMSCTSLDTITIPNSVIRLGRRIERRPARGMFEGCKQLKKVSLSNHIDYIGELCFSGCKSLKQLTIPNSVYEIGARAFEGCESLEDITIPSNVRIVRNRVFSSCKSLKSIYIPDTVRVFGENDPKSIATDIDDFISLMNALRYGRGMFTNCTSLESVRLPQNISKIREFDFAGCKSLQQISIPDTVTEIEQNGFFHCENLVSVQLSKQLQIISEKAFAFCTSLEKVSIPTGLTSLQACSFEGCTSLNSINLPKQLTHLDGNPFPGCSNLNIKVESDAFFISNSSLYSYDKRILHSFWGDKVCDDCVFDDVKHINRYCFSGSSVETITIPDHVQTIKDYAFSNCKDLKVAVLNGITELSSHVFDSCVSLEHVSIPNSVTRIKEDAFYKCSAIKSIVIPNSIRTIEDGAFRECTSLFYIEMPSSLEDISRESSKKGVFTSCKALTEIKFNSYVPSLKEFDFEGCDSLSKIIVPNGYKYRYKHKLGEYFKFVIEVSDIEDLLPF